MSLFGGDGLFAADSSSQAFPSAQQAPWDENDIDPSQSAQTRGAGFDLNDDRSSVAPATTEDEKAAPEQVKTRNEKHEYLSEGSLDTEEEEDEERPNKFRGKVWEWRRLTAPERQLAASLDQLQAEDLSLHLYNAHGLKQRVRKQVGKEKLKSWRSKESWIGNDKEWRPKNPWTAWPVRPDIVPREAEGFNREAYDDCESLTIKRASAWKPSTWLEEELMATALRVAKRRFDSRLWEGDVGEEKEAKSGNEEPNNENEDHDPEIKEAAYMTEGSQMGISDYSRKPRSRSKVGKEDQWPPLRPVVMADDDQAKRIIQPTTRHLLSSLDKLLAGLRHSRQAYALLSAEGDTSDGQLETEDNRAKKREELSQPSSNRTGRPRKPRLNVSAEIPVVPAQEDDDELSDSSPASAGRKRRVGRPRKYPKPLQGESYYMMRQRLKEESKATARDQRAARRTNTEPSAEHETAFAHSPTQRTPKEERRGRSRTRKDYESDSASDRSGQHVSRSLTREKEFKQSQMSAGLDLRDWSEVIGIASLVGWDPDVVQRAAARCAKLFGESIEMRTLGGKSIGPTAKRNTTITPFGVDIGNGVADQSRQPNVPLPQESQSATGNSLLNPLQQDEDDTFSFPQLCTSTEPGTSRPKTYLSGLAPYSKWLQDPQRTCPVPECKYSNHEFKKRWNLHNHIRRIHGEEVLSSMTSAAAAMSPSAAPPGTPALPTAPNPLMSAPTGNANDSADAQDRNPTPATPRMSTLQPTGPSSIQLGQNLDLVPHALLHPYDEMLGGVHVDGFLKPIPRPVPVRGPDRTKRKGRTDYQERKRLRTGSVLEVPGERNQTDSQSREDIVTDNGQDEKEEDEDIGPGIKHSRNDKEDIEQEETQVEEQHDPDNTDRAVSDTDMDST